MRRCRVSGWDRTRLTVSTVGSTKSDSARQRSMKGLTGAMSPQTDLSFSVPDAVNILLSMLKFYCVWAIQYRP